MKRVIIAPYSAALRTKPINPKSYPVRFWQQVVAKLNALDIEVIQIGVQGEQRVEGVSQFIIGWPLPKLRELIEDCDTWASVDSFLPHFCFSERLKSGVVIFSQSDPLVFGHPENVNLLKDRKYLRALQFQGWEDVPYNEAAFVLPEVVVEAVVDKLATSQNSRSPL